MRPVDGLELALESSEVKQVVLSARGHIQRPLGEFGLRIVNMKGYHVPALAAQGLIFCYLAYSRVAP